MRRILLVVVMLTGTFFMTRIILVLIPYFQNYEVNLRIEFDLRSGRDLIYLLMIFIVFYYDQNPLI